MEKLKIEDNINSIREKLEAQVKHISFNKETHQYFNQSGEEYRSVSSVIEQFVLPFDREEVSNRLAKRDNMPANEITTQWDIRRDLAIVRGTELHLYIETFLNTGRKIKTVTPIEQEVTAFHIFWEERNNGRYEVVTTELMVCDEEYKIAGTIDCIVRQKETGDFFIFDWKSNRKIETENKYQKMKEPLDHLDSCHFNKYSLQMSLYRFLLKRTNILQIKNCFLIHFHPDQAKENKKNNGSTPPYKVIATDNFEEYLPNLLIKDE